jgi:hypothetical protein
VSAVILYHEPDESSLHSHIIVPWWRYLLGLQTKPLSYSHSFYCRLHRRFYNRPVTNSSLTNCVDHSHFPSTLLTVDYFRWCPTIHCRLSALVASSLANYWLLSSPAGPPTLWLTVFARLSLRWADADGRDDTVSHGSFLHCDGLVTGETSVVYSPFIAVGLFSE